MSKGWLKTRRKEQRAEASHTLKSGPSTEGSVASSGAAGEISGARLAICFGDNLSAVPRWNVYHQCAEQGAHRASVRIQKASWDGLVHGTTQ